MPAYSPNHVPTKAVLGGTVRKRVQAYTKGGITMANAPPRLANTNARQHKAITTKRVAAKKPLRCGMVYFLLYDWLMGTPYRLRVENGLDYGVKMIDFS